MAKGDAAQSAMNNPGGVAYTPPFGDNRMKAFGQSAAGNAGQGAGQMGNMGSALGSMAGPLSDNQGVGPSNAGLGNMLGQVGSMMGGNMQRSPMMDFVPPDANQGMMQSTVNQAPDNTMPTQGLGGFQSMLGNLSGFLAMPKMMNNQGGLGPTGSMLNNLFQSYFNRQPTFNNARMSPQLNQMPVGGGGERGNNRNDNNSNV